MGSKEAGKCEHSPSVPPDRPWEEDVQRFQEGATEIVNELLAACLAFLRSYMPMPEAQAEDLAMEAIGAAWARLGTFQGHSSLKTWVIGFAKNKALTWRRKQIRHPEILLPEVPSSDAETDVETIALRSLMIDEALEKLLPDERRALELREREELSSKEIGEILGRSDDAVNSLLYRARQELGRYGDQIADGFPPLA